MTTIHHASRLLGLFLLVAVAAPSRAHAGTISQTVTFEGTTPEALYDLYMTAESHAAITGKPAVFVRAGKQLAKGEVGAELQAFGGVLTARVLDLVPGKRIVMSWTNFAWGMAVNKDEKTDLPSILVLVFRKTASGAQIELVQTNVPDYTVKLPDGETGALSALVNTHWNTMYWDRVRDHVKAARPRK